MTRTLLALLALALIASPAIAQSPPGLSDADEYHEVVVQAPVSGTVPATLSLVLSRPAAFDAFVPGVAEEYTASTTATVISTAGDAALTVADPSSIATGRLVNGAFALVAPLRVGVGGSTAPLPATILTYTGPISNDVVTIGFAQSIGESEPLRTGTYSKTLTFTLSTTNP